MPKKLCRNRKRSLTKERKSRTAKIRNKSLEMSAKYSYCVEKNLRCFVDTATRQCACCIVVKAEYSLFVLDKEWERV